MLHRSSLVLGRWAETFNTTSEVKRMTDNSIKYTVKDLIEDLQQENQEALVSVFSSTLKVDAYIYKTVSHADDSEVCLYIADKGEKDGQ